MIRLNAALAGALVMVLYIDAAHAQAPRRPAQPQASSAPSPPTILFQQDGVPFIVATTKARVSEVCALVMFDQASSTEVIISMDGSETLEIAVGNASKPPPEIFSRKGAQIQVSVKLGEVSQAYTILVGVFSHGQGWAEAPLPRAAMHHLQQAIASRAGMAVKIGEAVPILFTVPVGVAAALDNCVQTSLRSRMSGSLDRLNRTLPPALR